MKLNRRFGRQCFVNIQYRKISQARNRDETCSKHSLLQETNMKQLESRASLFFDLEDGGDTFLRNVALNERR
jgi:hypothetical protein